MASFCYVSLLFMKNISTWCLNRSLCPYLGNDKYVIGSVKHVNVMK